jgi:hypothetical protein
VAILIVGLGAVLSAVKVGQEVWIARHVRERVAALESEVASHGDPQALLENDHRALRELIAKGGYRDELRYYQDRAIPLLEELYRRSSGPRGEPARDAALLVLLQIDSPRSLSFFRSALPALPAPDLRREVEDYLARRSGQG